MKKMKQELFFKHLTRCTIDEQALSHAIESGKVYAAAVDVVSTEPILANNPLLQTENCIITPHIAWAAKKAENV